MDPLGGSNATNSTQYTYGPAIGLTLGLTNLLANALVVLALLKLKSEKLKKTTRYFLMYQSTSHLLLGVMGVVRALLVDYSCQLAPAGPCIVFFICSSTFLLALDSFVTMYKPYTHRLILTPWKAMFSILLTVIFPLVLVLISVLTGKDIEEDIVCFTVHDSYPTPVHIMISYAVILALMLLSVGFQGWTISLVYKMNRIDGVTPNVKNIPLVSKASTESEDRHCKTADTSETLIKESALSNTAMAEPVAGTSWSDEHPRSLQVSTHGMTQPQERITPSQVTVHVLSAPNSDGHTRKTSELSQETQQKGNKRSQSSQETPKKEPPRLIHQGTTGNRHNRQKRLLRLLTAALILIIVVWSPNIITAIVTAVYHLHGMETEYWYRWQVTLLAFLDGFLYPIILLAMSSELRACLRLLFCKHCRSTRAE